MMRHIRARKSTRWPIWSGMTASQRYVSTPNSSYDALLLWPANLPRQCGPPISSCLPIRLQLPGSWPPSRPSALLIRSDCCKRHLSSNCSAASRSSLRKSCFNPLPRCRRSRSSKRRLLTRPTGGPAGDQADRQQHLARLAFRIEQQSAHVLALFPNRLMNCGEVCRLCCGDVVKAAHRHVRWHAEPAACQRLECPERNHVAKADNCGWHWGRRNSIMVKQPGGCRSTRLDRVVTTRDDHDLPSNSLPQTGNAGGVIQKAQLILFQALPGTSGRLVGLNEDSDITVA